MADAWHALVTLTCRGEASQLQLQQRSVIHQASGLTLASSRAWKRMPMRANWAALRCLVTSALMSSSSSPSPSSSDPAAAATLSAASSSPSSAHATQTSVAKFRFYYTFLLRGQATDGLLFKLVTVLGLPTTQSVCRKGHIGHDLLPEATACWIEWVLQHELEAVHSGS